MCLVVWPCVLQEPGWTRAWTARKGLGVKLPREGAANLGASQRGEFAWGGLKMGGER